MLRYITALLSWIKIGEKEHEAASLMREMKNGLKYFLKGIEFMRFMEGVGAEDMNAA